MNRIEERLAALKEEGKKAFITYTTAGLPDYDTTKKIMFAQEKAGIDIMEIGVPFSDPIADGRVIQDASFKAIQNGASLEGTFTMMGKVRKAGLNSPVVFMLYYNTVYHYGVENFVNKCIENGVDGLIIPDLPFEEQGEIKDVLAKNEKSVCWYMESSVTQTFPSFTALKSAIRLSFARRSSMLFTDASILEL